MQENNILMLKKEMLLSGLAKKKPMMRFEIQSSSAITNALIVTLNDGTTTKAIYSNDRNYLEGRLVSDVDMINFSIKISSHKEDETCMNPGHPYYDKGQTCIVYDKDLNEISRTTYPYNCRHFWVDPMPIRGLQYYNLIGDGYGYIDTYPPPTITCRKVRNEASMEESVDAQQGITVDEWRFRRIGECYYTVSSIKTIPRACSEKCRYRQNLFERRLRDFIQRDLEFKSTCRYESKGGSYGWTYQCASNVPTLDKYRSNYRSSNNCGYSRSRSLCRNRNYRVISKEAIYA